MLRIVYFNKLFALKLIPFLIIIFVTSSLFEPLWNNNLSRILLDILR